MGSVNLSRRDLDGISSMLAPYLLTTGDYLFAMLEAGPFFHAYHVA